MTEDILKKMEASSATPQKSEKIGEITQKEQISPQELQEKILQEILEKYGVDLQTFIKDKNICTLQTLKNASAQTQNDILIEQQAKATYQLYLSEKLKTPEGTQEALSIDSLTRSIDSEKLNSVKKEAKTYIENMLNKYSFLDTQTKNIITLGIVNNILNSGVNDTFQSLVGGLFGFTKSLEKKSPQELSDMQSQFTPLPKDSGRTLAMEELFINCLNSYSKKFDEINKFFQEKKITDPSLQQNILSNIEWFRNPKLIESGPQTLDITKIDITKTIKNTKSLDVELLGNYMMNSRSKLIELTQTLNVGGNMQESVYNIINGENGIGEEAQGIIEFLLKIPIVGKIFAFLLGLGDSGEEGILQLREDIKNHAFLKKFKDLGSSKNEKGEEKEGTGIFKNINLSEIKYKDVKKELSQLFLLKNKNPDIQDDKFWENIFKEGVMIQNIKLKLTLPDILEKKTLSSSQFQSILKEGIQNFENTQKKQALFEEETKRKQEQEKLQKAIEQQNVLTPEGMKTSGENIQTGTENPEKNYLTFFYNIPLSNLDKDYSSEMRNFSPTQQESIKTGISTIKVFLSENPNIGGNNIQSIIQTPEFQTFQANRQKTLREQQNKLKKLEEESQIGNELETYFNNMSSFPSLENKITLPKYPHIGIEYKNNTLTIGEKHFVFEKIDSGTQLTGISMKDNKMILSGKIGIFTGEKNDVISKSEFTTILKTLYTTGSYTGIHNGKELKIISKNT